MTALQIPQTTVPTPSQPAPASERERKSPAKIAGCVFLAGLGWVGGWFGTKALLDGGSHHGAASHSVTASQTKSSDSQSRSGNAVAPDPTAQWQPVLLDGDASVRLPVGVEHDTKTVETAGGTVNVDMWYVSDGDLHYMVSRNDMPANSLSGAAAAHGAASGALSNVNATDTSFTDTTINGAPAVIGSGSVNGGQLFGAFVETHGALYQIIVGGPNATSQDLTQVVNTFSTP